MQTISFKDRNNQSLLSYPVNRVYQNEPILTMTTANQMILMPLIDYYVLQAAQHYDYYYCYIYYPNTTETHCCEFQTLFINSRNEKFIK